jgi:hypothetical protein
MANIFLKACPECARTTAVAASICSCGYTFQGRGTQLEASQEDIAREEALYEEYLSARAEQAVEAARVAKHLAELFPHDRQKALDLANLELAAGVAKADLASQRERLAEITKALTDSANSSAYQAA